MALTDEGILIAGEALEINSLHSPRIPRVQMNNASITLKALFRLDLSLFFCSATTIYWLVAGNPIAMDFFNI